MSEEERGHLAVDVDTDASRVDLVRLHRWLSEDTYWAQGRSLGTVVRSLAASVCFGAYDVARPREMVGFARLVTDRATFAWLCDVYVDPAARGRGVSSALLDAVGVRLDEWGVGRTLLATRDAHALYERHGFEVVEEPKRWMVRPSST